MHTLIRTPLTLAVGVVLGASLAVAGVEDARASSQRPRGDDLPVCQTPQQTDCKAGSPRPHKPCASEDAVAYGHGWCVWDARHMGNGLGTSFWVSKNKPHRGPINHYVSHKRAHELLNWRPAGTVSGHEGCEKTRGHGYVWFYCADGAMFRKKVRS